MSRLSEEPETLKFVRVESVPYEHDWDPAAYDPYRAKQVLHDYLDEAVEAERLGWDGYFATEHHFDGWTLVPQPNIFLAALAMRTSRMRLGQGVQVLPVHNPVWLAEQYGMLDLLSGGRLEVGLGRGNFDFEWDRYAEDHDDAPRLFDENLDLLRKALTETGFTHDGPGYQVKRPSTVYPRPLQDPLPTWIAAVTPGSVERVGRLGLNLAGPAIPDGGERLERYVESAAAQQTSATALRSAMPVRTSRRPCRPCCRPSSSEPSCRPGCCRRPCRCSCRPSWKTQGRWRCGLPAASTCPCP